MNAKPIIICILATLVLSSVAFAKPYGEKSHPDSVGDIVFADGTATAWREGLTLTEEQKKAAVAVIFYVGTECSNDSASRTLGVGLRNATDEGNALAWCTSSANAYSMSITTIQCDSDGGAGEHTFTGDLDGSDNLEQIGAFLRENGIPDDTADEENYPAFYFAKNYAEAEGSNVRGTVFESGWYLPSIAELFQIWKERERVNAAIEACGGTKFYLSNSYSYWSSSESATVDSLAYSLYFALGGWLYFPKSNSSKHVCAVRAFN